MTRLQYYPGCSMGGTARGYAASLRAVAGTLGLDLQEIPDWNCCGASEFFSIGPLQGYALVARNLALAEREQADDHTLVAPCSLCFVNLAKTAAYLRTDARLAAQVNDALDAANLSCTPGAVEVRHLFEVIAHDIGPDAIRSHVTRPLAGLRVVPYLGCLVTRPDSDERWRDKERPLAFDRMLQALGAEVVDYPLRTDCCGGHLSQISPGMGLEMLRRLLDAASRLDADLMATICPMCQMNIDLYQGEVNRRFRTSFRVPILFFTQLIGLAFGVPAGDLGIGSEVVGARAALAKIGVEVPFVDQDGERGNGNRGPERVRKPRPGRGPEIPMPRMLDPEEAES